MPVSAKEYQKIYSLLEEKVKKSNKRITELKKSLKHCIVKERMVSKQANKDPQLYQFLTCNIKDMNKEVEELTNEINVAQRQMQKLTEKYLQNLPSYF